MSHIEFRPKCLPSDVAVIISKQLASPLEGGKGQGSVLKIMLVNVKIP